MLFSARCKGANREGCCCALSAEGISLISRGIIWCFVFCSALPRLLVDLGEMIPHSSLLKGKTQTMLVTGLQGQEPPHRSHVSASPHCLQSRWLSLFWCLARCPWHRWLQEQPPSAVPPVLVETPRVFLSGSPRAAWRVSQSPGSIQAGTGRQGMLGRGTGHGFSACSATAAGAEPQLGPT